LPSAAVSLVSMATTVSMGVSVTSATVKSFVLLKAYYTKGLYVHTHARAVQHMARTCDNPHGKNMANPCDNPHGKNMQ
jgi:hypothetical protein